MSATKIGENTTNNSKLLFFTINLHSVTPNQISTYRKLNLFRLLTFRNAKKTQTNHRMPRVFLLCLKRNDPQTLKSGSCKRYFFSAYIIRTACFDKCFSFYVITKRHYFSWKFIVTLRLF